MRNQGKPENRGLSIKMRVNYRLAHVAVVLLASAWGFVASAALATETSPDLLAQTVLDKAGVHATVCEMPRVGNGILTAALARTGIAQVHGLAPDAQAAEAGRILSPYRGLVCVGAKQ